ncbi:MAG: hypothetical protein CMJ19_11720 [Phycisphaeraceae bacterium]|nr:hypothetical protein [Phycisphaeraceae bacterium]
MPNALLKIVLLLVLGSATLSLHAAEHQFPQADLSKLGNIPTIDTPFYIMEYHIWHKSPFGQESPDGYVHWDMGHDRIDRAIGPDWMRDKGPVGYPLLGLYNAEDMNVIRWQLACMQNTGVDGTFVQMFPEWNQGEYFDRTFIWDKIIDIADELGYKVGLHDEVQFRGGQPAQKWDVMGKRIGAFIKQYGQRSAFLKIKNQPAVAFQFWNRFNKTMSVEDLGKMIDLAEKTAGCDIYWILHMAPNDGVYAMDKVDAFITMANTNALNHRVSGYTDSPKQDWEMMQGQLDKTKAYAKKYPNKDLGLWVYDGFEESPKAFGDGRTSFRWMPRQKGKTLITCLEKYEAINPAFHILTSWNDWQENTAIEPGWQSDVLDGDPYFYCKLLAKLKGHTFTAPPLPAKESVDPWMWQTLYGIDRTPPMLTHVRYLPMAPAIVATAADTGSAIQSIKVAEHGDLYVDASDYAAPVFHGVTSINPGRTVEGGYQLAVNQPITVGLLPEMLKQCKSNMVYIGLEFTDHTAGNILVYYPCQNKLINYKPGDENRFDVCAGISLSNSGKQVAAVRPMIGFLKDQANPEIRIELKGTRKHPKPSPITVSRIHVFTDFAEAKAGLRLDAGKPDSQVQTVRVEIGNLKTAPTQKAAYIIATDASGNVAMPVVYHGVDAHAFMNRP